MSFNINKNQTPPIVKGVKWTTTAKSPLQLRGISAHRYMNEDEIPSFVNSRLRPTVLKRRFSDPVVDVDMPGLMTYKLIKLGKHSVHPTHSWGHRNTVQP